MTLKKIKFIVLIKGILFTSLFAQNGTPGSPFTSLSQAASVTTAGIYYFNVGSKLFSTQVSDYGWVLIATDIGGSSASNLPQVTSLTPTSRGILSSPILNSLIPITAVGISSSDGAINATTTNLIIALRINAFLTINQGAIDNLLFGTPWIGTGASDLNSQASYCNDINTLDAIVYHPCGDGNKFHWLPDMGQLAEVWNNGFISSSVQFNLWIQSSATVTPLPIELMNFNAVYNKVTHAVDLDWETATESNNNYFTVEKSSDGKVFEVVQIVKSKENSGFSNAVLKYNLTDPDPLKGTSYYRLKQTDFNGDFKYFKIIETETNLNDARQSIFYPNPIDNKSSLTIDLSGFEKQNVSLLVKDIEGRQLIYKNFQAESEVLICEETKTLLPGMYIIEITSDSKNTVRNKIIVK